MKQNTAILGFLTYEEGGERINGNMGFQDQQYALLWVQKNIEHFGWPFRSLYLAELHRCIVV